MLNGDWSYHLGIPTLVRASGHLDELGGTRRREGRRSRARARLAALAGWVRRIWYRAARLAATPGKAAQS